MYLSICHLSIYPSIDRSIDLSIYRFIHLSICLSTYLSTYLVFSGCSRGNAYRPKWTAKPKAKTVKQQLSSLFTEPRRYMVMLSYMVLCGGVHLHPPQVSKTANLLWRGLYTLPCRPQMHTGGNTKCGFVQKQSSAPCWPSSLPSLRGRTG